MNEGYVCWNVVSFVLYKYNILFSVVEFVSYWLDKSYLFKDVFYFIEVVIIDWGVYLFLYVW